ncbi:MAG: type VI secretion system-associated protein TagF [Pseudomonadota bacterium]
MDDDASAGGCGIYGKLPSKRDFIAVRIAGPVLTLIEHWLQGGVAASRNAMGGRWQETYLTAPIWRFWLGEQVAGTFCVGAVMPSVDGVGRYFPLTILSHGRPGMALLPPLDDDLDGWFTEIEARLLSALDPGLTLDAYGLLHGQRDALAFAEAPLEMRAQSLRRGMIWATERDQGTDSAPSGDRDEDYRIAAQTRTYWWTGGGDRFGPRFYSHPGMPDPAFFSALITGDT